MPPAPPVLADDLSCSQCRYNLRGLAPAGRCPECGQRVAATLSAVASAPVRFRPDLSRADPASRRRWTQGLTCVLVSAGVTVVVALLPESLRQPHGFWWDLVLAAAVTAWVFNGLGEWQVARADVAVDGDGRPTSARWLRVTCVLTVFLPGAVALNQTSRHHPYGLLLLPCAIAAPVATCLFQLRVRLLALAVHAPQIAGHCIALAVLLPIWACGFDTIGMMSGGFDSTLTLLFVSPNPACGSVGVAVEILRRIDRSDPSSFLRLLGVVIPVWALANLALVLRRLLTPAGAGRSTAPSSRP